MAADLSAPAQVNWRLAHCVIHLSGHIDRHTVPKLIAEIKVNEQCNERFGIDFALVEHVDTAGLAWILKVMAEARRTGQVVTLTSLPEKLYNLAVISGVEALLTSA